MTMHDEIKELVYYGDCSYAEAKKAFSNTILGANKEFHRQIKLLYKQVTISIWKTYNKIKEWRRR